MEQEHEQEKGQEQDSADRCPMCGIAMVLLVYGYPAGATVEAAKRGEVILGGCLVWDGQPARQCPRCGHPSDHRHYDLRP